MSFLDRFKGPDINLGLERFRAAERAVLLDVREPDEYADGHVPGSINLPLSSFDAVEITLPDRDRPVFVYCFSGSRSAQAAARLKKLGYRYVENLGGIRGYRGKKEILEDQVR